jgi:hypothetical protein
MMLVKKLALIALAAPMIANAGVLVFTGLSSEKVTIEDAPKQGKDVAYFKIEGVESPWAGKVIKGKKTSHHSGDRYSFEYELELSSGVKKRTYEMILAGGKELRNGSLVPKIKVFFEGMPDVRKPVELVYDADQTKASQKLDLPGEFARAPFKPEVD